MTGRPTPDPIPDSSHGPTIAQLVSGPLPDAPVARSLRLFGEGALYTGLGMFLALGWGVPSAGVLSIFLTAAALQPRLHELLDENRHLIWDRGASGAEANWVTTRSLLAAFLGVLATYLALAAITGAPRIIELLGPALHLGHLNGTGAEPDRTFGALAAHRVSLVVAFFGVAFVYRSYAALVGLAWAASVWGATPVVVAGTGVRTVAVAATMLVPALLDAAGIVLGCLAAIYASKGLVKYRVTDPRALRVVRASLLLLALGVALCTLAALLEVGLVRPLVEALLDGAGSG